MYTTFIDDPRRARFWGVAGALFGVSWLWTPTLAWATIEAIRVAEERGWL